MDVRLRAGARTLTVALASEEDDGIRATLEGVTHHVGAVTGGPRASAAGGTTVEELIFELEGRLRRALVARRPDRILVAVGGRVHAFEVGDESGGAHHGGAGSGAVSAPMPGKVVAVLVKPGDAVAVGAPLVVLEAMKMETTLVAEVAGRVSAVPAVAGALVDAGALLVEITPEERAAPPA